MSNISTIVSFLESKGLNHHAIAGILGNLNVESGTNPGAYNAKEGAIGIAQWEGSRRTALQSYASQHGTSETDLGTQLGFMYHEMQSSGIIGQLNSAGSASNAATLWDTQYERSSGSTRSQRISGAQQFDTSGNISNSVDATNSSTSTAAVPVLTDAQKKSALQSGAGSLYSLAASVPELSGLIQKAISTGQTPADFENAVQNSAWYKSHSDSTRQMIALKASDPATYAKNMTQAESHINALAAQIGVQPGIHLAGLATAYLSNGWNDDQLKQWFGANKAKLSWGDAQGGATGQALSQLQQAAADYGVPVGVGHLRDWSENIATGSATIDQFKQHMQLQASSIYPGLAKQLAAGQTTKQLADPYVQTMAQTLELNPNTINWSQDPMVKKALQTPVAAAGGAKSANQGTGTSAGAATTPGTTPLWQFEQQLRQDPRWNFTSNAKSATSAMLSQLGQEWGMSA